MQEQGEDGLRLMCVHAHPDDESSKGAAAMARYASQGVDGVVAHAVGAGQAAGAGGRPGGRVECRRHGDNARRARASGRRPAARTGRPPAVAPGATITPGNEASIEILERMTAAAPAGAPGRPIDIAHAVRFLASDEAAYVHGTVLDVDGGIVAARVG